MPTFPNWRAGNRITAGMLNSMLPLTVVKPADEPLTTSTVLQNDNDLVLPVIANAQYDFECLVIFTAASGTGDIKWGWTIPASANLLYQALHNEGGGTGLGNSSLVNSQGLTGFASGQGSGTNTGIGMSGSLVVASTAGSIQLTWAQNTSSATATTVKTGSIIKLTRTQ